MELSKENLSREEFKSKLIEKSDYLASSRPTAVNLTWAVEQQKALVKKSTSDINDLIKEFKTMRHLRLLTSPDNQNAL